MYLFIYLWALIVALATAQAQLNAWAAKHGMTSDQYESTSKDLVSQGYRLNYISGYTVNNTASYAAVWEKKTSAAWVANHSMTSAQYQERFDAYTSEGYRPVVVNGYTVNGVDYYAAIFDKSASGPWIGKHGMADSVYQSNLDSYSKQGYCLKHVSGYSVEDEVRYAAIWQKPSENICSVTHHGMTFAGYQKQFDDFNKRGYTLTLVNGYQVAGVDYYAAIWERKEDGPVIYAKHNMTRAQYQDEFDNSYYQGYMLKAISGYNQGQSDRYAAIWENGPISSKAVEVIDKDVNAYTKQYNITGLSLAITKDDRLVFAKGYGLADKAAGTIVTPNSLFRIMSISKSITATSIMKLIQEGHFKISDKVFGPGSILGTKYGSIVVDGVKQYKPGVTSITVQQLLEHQSGFGNDADPEQLLKTKTPAEAVSAILDTIPLAHPPNTAAVYSNFGFLVLGRIIADVSGHTYETYVKDSILSPSGVTRMRLANDSKPIANEVTYYPLGATSEFRIREFDSFGGWIGSPIDLCKFSTRVDQLPGRPDTILNSTSEEKMWESSSLDPSYAKGWIVNIPGRGHNGAFRGTGSYFMQRTDGMSFALIMNNNAAKDEYSARIRQIVDEAISKVTAWPEWDLF